MQGMLRRVKNTRGKEESSLRSYKLELHKLKKKQKHKKVLTQTSFGLEEEVVEDSSAHDIHTHEDEITDP